MDFQDEIRKYRTIILEAELDEITRRGLPATTKLSPEQKKLRLLITHVRDQIKEIMNGAARGENMSDEISDELGDYYFPIHPDDEDFEDYYDVDDDDGYGRLPADEVLQNAYQMVSDTIDSKPKTQYAVAKKAFEMLSNTLRERGWG